MCWETVSILHGIFAPPILTENLEPQVLRKKSQGLHEARLHFRINAEAHQLLGQTFVVYYVKSRASRMGGVYNH